MAVIFLGSVVDATAAMNSSVVANVALEFVRSSEDYVNNGGFGETVLGIWRDQDNPSNFVVAVEYLAECGTIFVAHITFNPRTMDVIKYDTEPLYDVTRYPHGADNWSRIADVYAQSTQWMLRMMKLTMEVVRDKIGEEKFAEVQHLLDEASTAFANGEYETGLDLILKVYKLVNNELSDTHDDKSPRSSLLALLPFLAFLLLLAVLAVAGVIGATWAANMLRVRRRNKQAKSDWIGDGWEE